MILSVVYLMRKMQFISGVKQSHLHIFIKVVLRVIPKFSNTLVVSAARNFLMNRVNSSVS